MIATWTERPSHSPLVKSVWWHTTSRAGSYMSAADGGLDLVVLKEAGKVRTLLSGPATKAQTIHYKANGEALGIRFRMGVYLPNLPAKELLDTNVLLPTAGVSRFTLEGKTFSLPTFENAEQLVNQLAKQDSIRRDPLVTAYLEGQAPHLSLRTIQRRFAEITGLGPHILMQIRRAEEAAKLLEKGIPLPHAATEAGYTDQSHLTHAARKFLGYTPSQFRLIQAQYAKYCR